MVFFEKFGKSAYELKSLRCLTVTGVLIALDLILKGLSIKITADLKITFAYIALAVIGMLYGPTVAFLSGVITDIIGFIIAGDGGFSPLFTLIEGIGAMIYGIFLYDIKPTRNTMTFKSAENSLIKELMISGGIGLICGAVVAGVIFVLSLILAPSAEEGGNIGKLAVMFSDSVFMFTMSFIGFVYGAFFTFIIRTNKTDKQSVAKYLRIIFSKVTVVIVCNLVMTPIAMILSGYTSFDSTLAGYPLRLVKNAVQCPIDCIILITVLFPILIAYRKIFPDNKTVPETRLNNAEASEINR